ncbi:MAG: hypothetical protein JO111_16160 [Caulobacteraceae bacterium]|nr:hypothetical protein [Caulobacteraceae bacterium]
MRRIGWGLVAALIFAIAAPAASWAAPKAAAPAAAAITKDARDKGTAAAPGLISAAGISCDVADARLIGEGSDPKTKEKQTLYELACKNNEGMLVMKKGDTVQAYSCLQADQPGPDGKPSTTQCMLPANADPKAQLVPYLQKAGLTSCTPDKARAIGQNATNTFFEVACANNMGGYILETTAPMDPTKAVIANPCIMVPEGGNISCTLTDRAAQLAVVDKLNAQANKNCTIKEGGRGFLAATQSGKYYFEEACQDGKGYLLVENGNGTLDQVIPCAEADPYFGGCKLTDARQAKTEQAGLYTQLAKKAGYNCDVTGYAPLPGSQMAQGDEVVELKCSNRPDGAIAFFPPSDAQQAGVFNCAVSELLGYRCALTKPDAAYPALTEALKAVGKNSCTVSEARDVGVSSAEKKAYVEVGCSDGLQGYMLQYSFSPPAPLTPQSAIICAQATSISGGCTLPGNTKKS